MLKKIGIALAAILAVLVIVIATRPDDFKVERSTTVDASPDVIFPLVNDFHGWTQWSPWEALDPTMKRTYEGAPAGKGAGYTWAGNDEVGEGRMTIVDAKPNEMVDIKLEFLKPFEATNKTVIALAPAGGKTTVTWTMTGESAFMMKAMGLFMSMDEMVGADFEKGLAKLKAVSEEAAKKRAAEAAAAKVAADAAAKLAEEAAAKAAADAAALAADAGAPPAP